MCVHILFIHCIIYNNTYIFHYMGIHNYTFREMFLYMRVAESWIRSRCTSKAGGFPGNSRPTSRGRLQPSRWLWVEPQLGLRHNTGSAFTQFCWIFSFIKSWAFVPKCEPAANGDEKTFSKPRFTCTLTLPCMPLSCKGSRVHSRQLIRNVHTECTIRSPTAGCFGLGFSSPCPKWSPGFIRWLRDISAFCRQ